MKITKKEAKKVVKSFMNRAEQMGALVQIKDEKSGEQMYRWVPKNVVKKYIEDGFIQVNGPFNQNVMNRFLKLIEDNDCIEMIEKVHEYSKMSPPQALGIDCPSAK